MTETQLLAELSKKFERISSELSVVNGEDDKGITTKSVNVFATDISGEFPVAICKNILYYVMDAGKETESAFFHIAMPAIITPGE